MITTLVAWEALGFEKIELDFAQGLNVFTGPSGAGKSVLMQTLLSTLGRSEALAKKAQIGVVGWEEDELYDISDDDESIICYVKGEKVRYLINGTTITKKGLLSKSEGRIGFIGPHEKRTITAEELLTILDNRIALNQRDYEEKLTTLALRYETLKHDEKILKELEKKGENRDDLREFLAFECQKIAALNPKEGEEEELLTLKKEMSRHDKTEKLLHQAEAIFNYESVACHIYDEAGVSSEIFREGIENFRTVFETMSERLSRLEGIDAGALLERLEQLNALSRRYGSVSEALETLAIKRKELELLDEIEFDIAQAKRKVTQSHASFHEMATAIHYERNEALCRCEEELFSFLEPLSLPRAHFSLSLTEPCLKGIDTLSLTLGETPLSKVSSGELNRLRLALLALDSVGKVHTKKALIVDEIDANVSGEESAAVANLLAHLGKTYQIFAISHQPQLSSKAQAHFLVTKNTTGSTVRRIMKEERVAEVARIISGETITNEALRYAQQLIGE